MPSLLQFGSVIVLILSLFDNDANAAMPSPSNSSRNMRQRALLISSVTEVFVEKIFREYGDNRTGKISREKLKDLMEALHLGHLPNETKHEDPHEHRHDAHRTKRSTITRRDGRKQTKTERRKRGSIGGNDDSHDGEQHKCMTQSEMLALHGINSSEGVSRGEFINLCPSLIYQIEGHSCEPTQEKEEHLKELEEHSVAKWEVWTYGLVSITIISLTSLCAIAVVPLMGRSIYTRAMSFLVALAVGTLAGDALLHLIPHAFVPTESQEHSHDSDSPSSQQPVYKACAVMFGIYGFFLVECIMKVRAARNDKHSGLTTHACDNVKLIKRHKGKQQMYYNHTVGSRLAGMQRCHSCDHAHFTATSGEPRHTAHPGCSKSAYLDLTGGEREECAHEEKEVRSLVSSWNSRENCFHESVLPKIIKHSFSDSELAGTLRDENCVSLGESNDNFRFSDVSYNHGNNVKCVHEKIVIESSSSRCHRKSTEGDEHEHGHVHVHSHGRSHGHSHHIDKNASIATVAWMVIVGDGFHNFGDGMAVGAAFAASLGTGLTTAIAVFCHELPHELGDFAVLVKSGFTIRQAITYNMVSAVIAYIGLVLGILIGNISSAHGWVLSLTAGMFLYISLVDMLPELNKLISDGPGWGVFLCQNAGLLTGVAIMLVIALHESH